MQLEELYLPIGVPDLENEKKHQKCSKNLFLGPLKTFKRLVLAPQDPYRPQEKLVYTVFDVESEFRG